jgi:hypothetical protein
VAEKEERFASIPWLPLITLIGLGSGVLLFFPKLTSSRPRGGEPLLARDTFDTQTINARLWQDPLGVAMADREKSQTQVREHSVAGFQRLFIKKCFESSTIDSLNQQSRFEEQVKEVQILAVMIPGGPYVEDVERRLRSRRAVIEGLGVAGYHPEKEHAIGYFCVPWLPLEPNIDTSISKLEQDRSEDERPWFLKNPGIQPARRSWKEPDAAGLVVPYEWCELSNLGAEPKPVSHVLVLWLRDDAFGDAPLARLADLNSWFRLKLFGASENPDIARLPVFKVLGPDSSGSLHTMVKEAKEDLWNNETRECLATTHIYSSQAAAAESRLLDEIPPMGERHTCKNLIEQKVKRLEPDSGFCFERTILPDDRIVETLWQELKYRGVKLDDHIVIVSEEDTYCARALCSTFTTSNINETPLLNLHSYAYLRGIDGRLPSDEKNEKDEKETKGPAESGGNNPSSDLRPTERTEGLNQADDVRRLAQELQKLDRELRDGSGRKQAVRAVGLLGSDVYDKLELLKAFRPMLPEAVFFTNNLDARLAHPDEWNETHNLVVVSARGLSLKDSDPKVQHVAPFRDSGQTALFEATLKATGQIYPGDNATPKSPLIFEIGRNGAKELSVTANESITISERSNLLKRYLPSLACFIAFGSLLLAWICHVSRVNSSTSDAETHAEQINEPRVTHNGHVVGRRQE